MQSNFKRYEKKYLITTQQHRALQKALARYMAPDRYGEYLVQNLYYDTVGWDIIRASIEKPLYKEKLRLRCYGEATDNSKLYLELKKKFKGVVYKRRIAISAQAIGGGSVRGIVAEAPSQIARELDFYLQSNNVAERIYIAYHRTAFSGILDNELRVTFDTDIFFRLDNLSFSDPGVGQSILPEGKMLMEIKALGGMPLWLTTALSENEIFPTSFSKFGTCYTDYILKSGNERKMKVCA